MATKHITESALLDAPAATVYHTIADYRDGHPRILPRPPFVSLDVDKGGVGAGTEIHFDMRVLGQRRTLRATITEPDPGRVLVETNDDGTVTTFTVEPRDDGRRAYVTITSDLPIPSGIAGRLQGWLLDRILRPTYHKELAQLEAVARADAASPR